MDRFSIKGYTSDEVYNLSSDYNCFIQPNFPVMVSTDQEFGSLFFQVSEVIDNGCIEIGFDPGSREISGAFILSPLFEIDPMLRKIMLI